MSPEILLYIGIACLTPSMYFIGHVVFQEVSKLFENLGSGLQVMMVKNE